MSENNNSYKRFGRFINKNAKKKIRRGLFQFLLWKIGFYDLFEKDLEHPKDFKYPKSLKKFNKEDPWVLWIGHCSFVIKAHGITLITDPIWNETCSPVKFIGPKRKNPPPIQIAELNQIDYVSISHNHYDHMDKKSILNLYKKFPNITWIVPLGLKKWFTKRKIKNVIELDWWENYSDKKIKIHSVPAQHYSGRSVFDGNKVLWMGLVYEMLESNKKIYFTGDTGYNDKTFKMIGERFEKIDLSLIPIGTYKPRKFMGPVHIDPKEAVQVHKDVNSVLSISMHHKTFHLSDEHQDLPPYELYLNLKEANIEHKNFLVVEPGTYVNW